MGGTDGAAPYPVIRAQPLSAGQIGIIPDVIYGTTAEGGYNSSGIIYSCGLSGENYSILHRFGRDMLVLNVDGTSQRDGSKPSGPLTVANKYSPSSNGQTTYPPKALYGTTEIGGEGGYGQGAGTFFRLDNAGYRIIANFGTSTYPLINPRGRPTLHNGVLYGCAADDIGDTGGGIYTYDTTTGVFSNIIFGLMSGTSNIRSSRGTLYVDSSANIYGTGVGGGDNLSGGLYKVTRYGELWTRANLWSAPAGTTFSENIVADSSNNLYFLKINANAAQLMIYDGNTVTMKKELLGTFDRDQYSIYYSNRTIFYNTGDSIVNYNIDTGNIVYAHLSEVPIDFYQHNNTTAYISNNTSIVSLDLSAETVIHAFSTDLEITNIHDTIVVGDTVYILSQNGLASCDITGLNYTLLDTSSGNYGATCLFSHTIDETETVSPFGNLVINRAVTKTIFFSIGKQIFAFTLPNRDANGAITEITPTLDLSAYATSFDRLISLGRNIYGLIFNNSTTRSELIQISDSSGSVIHTFEPFVTIGPLIVRINRSTPTPAARAVTPSTIYGTTYVTNPSTNDTSGTIFRIILSDNSITHQITHTTDKFMNGIDLGSDNRIFGCTTDGIIFSADISGGPLTELVSDNDPNLTHSAVTFNNFFLYYTVGTSVYRVDVGGNVNESVYDLPAALYNGGEGAYQSFTGFDLNSSSISIKSGPAIINVPFTFSGPPPPPPLPGQPPYPTTVLAFGTIPGGGTDPLSTIDVDGKLYGVCEGGGANNKGTLFRVRPSGQFFEDNLIDFVDGSPCSDLIKDEYFIYGALNLSLFSEGGSTTYRSQIFRYNYNYNSDFIMFDNSGMLITHLLQGSASSNSNLYGAFTNTDLSCVIFSTPKNVAVENSYAVLRTFPSPSMLRCLTVQDGVLYGVIAEAQSLTANSKLFKINVDGTGYTEGKSFVGSDASGNGIVNLTIADGYVYGFSSRGGINNRGTLFRCNLNLSSGSYTVLHNFDVLTGYPSGKEKPVTVINGTIYGVCSDGGPGIGDGYGTNSGGVIFSYTNTYNVIHGLVTGNTGSLSSPIQAIFKGNRVFYIAKTLGAVGKRAIVEARGPSAGSGGGGMGSGYLALEPMTLVFDVSGGTVLDLPILGESTLTVSWGDASSNIYTGSETMAHTYSGPARKVVVTIDGPVTMFGTGNSWSGVDALTDVSGWGTAGTLFSLFGTFQGSDSLVTVPPTIPDTVVSTKDLFFETIKFNDPNVTQWDMSKVTDVTNMFKRATAFKQDLYTWDISSSVLKLNFFSANTGIPDGAGSEDATEFNPYSPFAPPSGRNPNLTAGLTTFGSLTGKLYGTHGSAIFEYDISMNEYSLLTTTYLPNSIPVTPSPYSNVIQISDGTTDNSMFSMLLTGLDTPELLTYSLATGELTVIPLDTSCGAYPSQFISSSQGVYFTTYNETDNKSKLVEYNVSTSMFTVMDLSAQVNEGAGALAQTIYDSNYYIPTQFGSIYKFMPLSSTITKLANIPSTVGYSLPSALKLTIDDNLSIWGATLYDGPGSTITTRGGYVFRCDINGQNFRRFDVSAGYCTDMGAQNLLVVDNGYVYGASAAYNPVGPAEPGNVGYVPGYVYRMTTNGDGFTKLWDIPEGQTVESILGIRNEESGRINKLLIQPVSAESHLGMVRNADMIPAVVIPTSPPPAQPNENYTKLVDFPEGSEPKGFIDISGYLYGTTTTGLFRLRLSDSSYNSLQIITGCVGQLYRIGNVIYGLTGSSLFSYNTDLGQNPFQTVKNFSPSTPNPNMTLDASGNLYISDSSGGLWRASYPTGTVSYLTNTSPRFASNSALSADGGYVWGVTSSGGVPGDGGPNNQLFIKVSTSSPYTQTTVATIDINLFDTASLVVDSGHYYMRSNNFDPPYISRDLSSTPLHIFNGGLTGFDAVGPTLIDRINKRLYGICKGGGGLDGVGTNAGGILYSIDISNNAFTRIIDYVNNDAIRGFFPSWLSITPETGQAYVVTTGGSGPVQTLVAIRAGPSGSSMIGNGNLPGFAPQCFGEGSKILTGETWTPIENLRIGDLVTTYSHGLRPITHIGKGHMINNPDLWHTCMYRGQLKGFDTLLVTGGHAFLVDYLSESQQRAQAGFWGSEEVVIDDKILMVAPVSDKFTKITDRSVYVYYHFVVENDGDDDRRYGVYANGFLTETPSKNQFVQHGYSSSQ